MMKGKKDRDRKGEREGTMDGRKERKRDQERILTGEI